ncbi:MAG: hypothetical protein IT173_15260 [Acidobacteria bacterium]|nr:hypothetical protein [Acidobacteriota bacterium]
MDRRTVLLVTGGKPDPKVKDEYQPNGCGTAVAKLRVFNDRVELASSGENGPPICPSSVVDEVFFAA